MSRRLFYAYIAVAVAVAATAAALVVMRSNSADEVTARVSSSTTRLTVRQPADDTGDNFGDRAHATTTTSRPATSSAVTRRCPSGTVQATVSRGPNEQFTGSGYGWTVKITAINKTSATVYQVEVSVTTTYEDGSDSTASYSLPGSIAPGASDTLDVRDNNHDSGARSTEVVERYWEYEPYANGNTGDFYPCPGHAT